MNTQKAINILEDIDRMTEDIEELIVIQKFWEEVDRLDKRNITPPLVEVDMYVSKNHYSRNVRVYVERKTADGIITHMIERLRENIATLSQEVVNNITYSPHP